jgi:hypothetical protein
MACSPSSGFDNGGVEIEAHPQQQRADVLGAAASPADVIERRGLAKHGGRRARMRGKIKIDAAAPSSPPHTISLASPCSAPSTPTGWAAATA